MKCAKHSDRRSGTRDRMQSLKKLLDVTVENGVYSYQEDDDNCMQFDSFEMLDLDEDEREQLEEFLASCKTIWISFGELRCSFYQIRHLHQLLNEVVEYRKPDRARLNDLITLLDKEINSFTGESARVCQRVNQMNSDVKERLKDEGLHTRIQRSQIVAMMERLYLIIADFNKEQIGYQEENRSRAARVAERQSDPSDEVPPSDAEPSILLITRPFIETPLNCDSQEFGRFLNSGESQEVDVPDTNHLLSIRGPSQETRLNCDSANEAVTALAEDISEDVTEPAVSVSLEVPSELRDVLYDVMNRHEATLHIEAAVDELNHMFQHFLIITQRGTARANDIDKNMEQAKERIEKVKRNFLQAVQSKKKKRKMTATVVPIVLVLPLLVILIFFACFKFA